MANSFLISVIIPVYNTKQYLTRCFDSVINQTYNNIEILIINDGSTDGSQEIIDSYKNKYPQKIKNFVQENHGLSSARNFGVSKSTGDYICFLDSDDFLDKNLFKSLIPYMGNNIDLIKYKTKLLNPDLTLKEKISGPIFDITTGENAFNKMFVKDVLMCVSCFYLYNANFYKSNNFQFKEATYHEDFGLIPLILLSAGTCVSTNIYGYNYMILDNTIIRNSDYKKTKKKAYDMLLHYDNMLNQLLKLNITPFTIKNVKSYYTNSIFKVISSLKFKDKINFRKELQKRKLVSNLQVHNIKQLIKKWLFFILFS